MVKLIAKRVEEILVPPLPEYSYICGGEIKQSQCKGSIIFRDPDFILITSQEILESFSIRAIINNKLKGRKLQRWVGYIKKYDIELEGQDTRVLLEDNALLTIYVDGISVCDIDGEIVTKEYRIVGSDKNLDGNLKSLKGLKPDLILVTKRDFWTMLTAYKVIYITPDLRKALSKLVGLSRMECNSIEYDNTTICYIS